MQSNLSNQAKEILENKIALRNSLSQVLPKEIINYIMELIIRDSAHEKFLELTKN